MQGSVIQAMRRPGDLFFVDQRSYGGGWGSSIRSLHSGMSSLLLRVDGDGFRRVQVADLFDPKCDGIQAVVERAYDPERHFYRVSWLIAFPRTTRPLPVDNAPSDKEIGEDPVAYARRLAKPAYDKGVETPGDSVLLDGIFDRETKAPKPDRIFVFPHIPRPRHRDEHRLLRVDRSSLLLRRDGKRFLKLTAEDLAKHARDPFQANIERRTDSTDHTNLISWLVVYPEGEEPPVKNVPPPPANP